MRYRLRLHTRAVGEGRTRVTVERAVFRGERALWLNKDEPAEAIPHVLANERTEEHVLAAIGRAL